MSTLISSPFFFDSSTVRDECVDALGLSSVLSASAPANEIVVVTGSTTLNATDVNKTILVNSASPATITIPLESSPGFGSFAQIAIIGIGNGTVTIAADIGVIVRTTETLVLRKKYSAVVLTKQSNNIWLLNGDTVPALSGYITELDIPDVNTSWDTFTIPDADISNISYRGVKPTLGVGSSETYQDNTIVYSRVTIPPLLGMPFEAQIDGIELLHLNTEDNISTSFFLGNLSTGLGTDNITFEIGVSPFPIGGEKWLLAGIRLQRTSGVWTGYIIQRGLFGSALENNPYSGVTVTTTDIDLQQPIRVSCSGSTSFPEITASYVLKNSTPLNARLSTVYELPINFSEPLYTRIFVTHSSSGYTQHSISFDIYNYNSTTNGKGNNLPIRFTSSDNKIVEIDANVL